MRSHEIDGGAGPSGSASLAPPHEAGRAGRASPTTGAYRRAGAQLASVVIGIGAITAYVQLSPRPGDWRAGPAPPPPPVAPAPVESTGNAAADAAEPPPAPAASKSLAPPTPPPAGDRAKLAAAESALDAASRDRARAEERAADSARRLARAAHQAAVDALRARKLAYLIRDPSTRIAQAAARGGFLRGERDKRATELATLRSQPRPKSVSILSKSPVARPAAHDESHFELRHNRITSIDLNRLLDLTKADAQIRIRMADRYGGISSKVGPVGAFSLAYELVPTMPSNVEELIERRNIRRFDLKGWELIPEADNRGEIYEATQNPISEFTRAINRISPNRATVTLWVYPDSFALYRRIRNDLVERGFSVAARPLPEGLAIRGSPLGTMSAAQ